MKKILITGAAGFLGRYVAAIFKVNGFETYGIGHGMLDQHQVKERNLDHWFESTISLQALYLINTKFDVIVHCGGSGSVGTSLDNPMLDFQRTVDSTLAVLEYIRLYNKEAYLIYPSSPAVQGVHGDCPIKESDPCHPVSPYGVHKKIAEDLCFSYRDYFDIEITVVRFFSIYGPELKKQLLWDACLKLSANESAEFWGDGTETRDFIHVNDAASFLFLLAENSPYYSVVNCGSGEKTTVRGLVDLLKNKLLSNSEIIFNGKGRDGDPKYYWADVSIAKELGWMPNVSLDYGLQCYADWYVRQF